MNEFNNIALHILATLNKKPGQTGYGISKEMKGIYSHQLIYRQCAKLRELTWLESKQIPQTGKPDRIEYTITKKRDLLIKALQRSIASRPIYVRDSVFELNAITDCVDLIGEFHVIDWLIRFKLKNVEFKTLATDKGDTFSELHHQNMIVMADKAIDYISQ